MPAKGGPVTATGAETKIETYSAQQEDNETKRLQKTS